MIKIRRWFDCLIMGVPIPENTWNRAQEFQNQSSNVQPLNAQRRMSVWRDGSALVQACRLLDATRLHKPVGLLKTRIYI